MSEKFPTLYNIDEKGKVRVWWMEIENSSYRTVSGIEGGALVESGWTTVEGKNVGRSNETTAKQQAFLEVEAKYVKKKDRKYSEVKGEATRSKIIEPMLAEPWKKLKKIFQDVFVTPVFSQPKLDGIRCIVTKDGMFSRTGKPIVSCPHIRKSLNEVFAMAPNLIVDGELYNHRYRDNFNTIQSLITSKKPTSDDLDRTAEEVEYHVYDIMDTGLKFSERFSLLNSYLNDENSPIKFVETTLVKDLLSLDAKYSEYLNDGYEGQMVRLDTPYVNKRTNNLIKRKEFMDTEYKVLEIVEGNGNWAGYAKSVLCYDPINEVEFSSGIKGNQEFTKQLLEDAQSGIVPKYVTVRYPNLTPDGIPRFPVAVAFYFEERDT